jgi:hypothetical protein
MIAALLYLIGLIAVLVSIAIAGFSAPPAIQSFMDAVQANENLIDAAFRVATAYSDEFTWVVIGLLLMAAGRVIMLLSAINRSLRGQN